MAEVAGRPVEFARMEIMMDGRAPAGCWPWTMRGIPARGRLQGTSQTPRVAALLSGDEMVSAEPVRLTRRSGVGRIPPMPLPWTERPVRRNRAVLAADSLTDGFPEAILECMWSHPHRVPAWLARK